MRLMSGFFVGGMCQTRVVIESRENWCGKFPNTADTTGRAPCGVPRLGEGANIVEIAVLGTAVSVRWHDDSLTKRAIGRRRREP